MNFLPTNQEWVHVCLASGRAKRASTQETLVFQLQLRQLQFRGCRGTIVQRGKNVFNGTFEEDVPESILAHRPFYMLVQWIDLSHVPLGFKANRKDRGTYPAFMTTR
jgi:hypothetical protein